MKETFSKQHGSIVKRGYNDIAEQYLKSRNLFNNSQYLASLSELLQPRSTILDVGCGAGKPVDEYFLQREHRIIGIDISEKQLGLARKQFPQATYILEDMSNLREHEYKVDAVVSLYAIFHISRTLHARLLSTLNSFLRPGGLLLVTLGTRAWEGTKLFHGVEMYWSMFPPETNRLLTEEAGFRILQERVESIAGEHHHMLLAEKDHDVKTVQI